MLKSARTTKGESTRPARVVLRALLFLFLSPVVLIIIAPLSKGASPLVGMLETGVITSIITFLLTALFVRWDGLRLRDVGTGPNTQTPARLVLGFFVGIAIVLLQGSFLYAGGHTHWILRKPHLSIGVILLALAAYLALALREELAFRGYSLRRIETAKGMWISILIMVIVFSLEHAAGGWTWSRALLGPPVGALLFGMAALATRGVAVPLGIHSAFNFGQWFMGQKEIAGPLQLVVDPGFARQAETLGYAGYLAGVLLATAGFWLWCSKRSARKLAIRQL
ncbi:MAG TPA: CPBP family intramembrane glutamic endopeptidase [Acidobacteriaceae bacterium]|nr:CPBP family intramembrane glutamic endopeptidase [Acidobacteriaceae bacterium]